MAQIFPRAAMTTTVATVYPKVIEEEGCPLIAFWPGHGDGSHSAGVQSTD